MFQVSTGNCATNALPCLDACTDIATTVLSAFAKKVGTASFALSVSTQTYFNNQCTIFLTITLTHRMRQCLMNVQFRCKYFISAYKKLNIIEAEKNPQKIATYDLTSSKLTFNFRHVYAT